MGTREKLFRQKLADQIEKLLTQSEKVFTTQKLTSEWIESMLKDTQELTSRLTVYKFLHDLQEDDNLQIEFLEFEDSEDEKQSPNIPKYGDEILKEIDEFEQSDAIDVEIVENEIEKTEPEVVSEEAVSIETETPPEPVQEKANNKPEKEVADSKPTEINDMVSESKNSLADKLRKKPIQKLAESIALNERFLFSNELFNGNMESFKRALNELDHIASIDDAKRYIEIQLKEQHDWKMESDIVARFVLLVERRFN